MNKNLLFCLAAAGTAVLSSCADPSAQGYAMDGRPLNPNWGRTNPTGHHSSNYSYADRATHNRVRDNDDRSLTQNNWRDNRRGNLYGRTVSYDPRSAQNPRSPWSPGGRAVLPSEARRVMYRGNVYYTHNSTWYRPAGNSYVVVSSPY